MFHNPGAPYTTSNNFTNFTPNFYTRPYILSHVVPTFFASAPPEGQIHQFTDRGKGVKEVRNAGRWDPVSNLIVNV